MKDFLAYWLVFQLVAIGASWAGTVDDYIDGKCDNKTLKEAVSESPTGFKVVSVLVPLVHFLPSQKEASNLCK